MRPAIAAFCGLAMWIGSAAAAEAPRLDGHWEGVIVVRPGEFEVDMKLDLVRAADGSLSGHLSYPDQGPTEYKLDTVQVEEDNVLITSTDEQGTVSIFQGKSLDGGKILRGDLTEGGKKAPFELHRTDVVAAPKAPVVQGLSKDGAELKAQFNQDQGKVRVLMILSPTCGPCRTSARLVARHLREQLSDPGLSVYIVWEQLGAHDTLEAATQVAALLADERIHNFWSPDRFASNAFQAPVGIQRTTAWDVFLLFGKGKRWTDAPPAFDRFMHNQKLHEELPKDRLLNADRLAEEVKALLAAPSTAPASKPDPTPHAVPRNR
jgi:hypothetical protein